MNPFKNIKELKRDIETYLRKNSSAIYNNSSRISDFFEMACYNNIVRFYEHKGYNVKIKNLVSNKFRYKCSTSGNPSNFSYFEISKNNFVYEIRHNINIQSYHQEDIFTTPDISIIKGNSIESSTDFYNTKKIYYFIKNKSVISVNEVKNFNPFPELMFNFIGTINELKPNILRIPKYSGNNHLASSLFISGKANRHAERIIKNLQSRYHINVLSDLFNLSGVKFNKGRINKMKQV